MKERFIKEVLSKYYNIDLSNKELKHFHFRSNNEMIDLTVDELHNLCLKINK